jgi:hypothetical protein
MLIRFRDIDNEAREIVLRAVQLEAILAKIEPVVELDEPEEEEAMKLPKIPAPPCDWSAKFRELEALTASPSPDPHEIEGEPLPGGHGWTLTRGTEEQPDDL